MIGKVDRLGLVLIWGIAFGGWELLELAVLTIEFFFNGVEDKAVLLDDEVVIVNLVPDGLLEFLDVLLFEF